MALAALHDAHAHATARPPLLSIAPPAAIAGVGPAGATLAAGAACAQVLRMRYPNQAHLLEPAWLHWLEYFGFGSAGSQTEGVGRAFGNLVHQRGANDSATAAADQFTPSGAPYTHISPPKDAGQGYAGGKWGATAPLLAGRVAGFPRPPGRVSAFQVQPTSHYAADLALVASKGEHSRTNGTRTLPEEVIGIAWGYDGPAELGTPPRLYLQVVLTVLDLIEARSPGALSAEDELSVLAGVAIAMADAGIDAWHYKYSPDHMMWRPAVGIPGALPGNGVADPNWEPLGRPDTNGSGRRLTPNFPAYPSGHATFGAAAFQLLRVFLVEKGLASFDANGVDDIRFDFVSDEFNGRNKDPVTMQPRDHVTLGYESLWKAIVDNSISRVFLGVHWQFDGITKRNGAGTDDEHGVPASPADLGRTGGVWLGAMIANQIASKLGVSPATIAASRIA
jgi:vanadium chloroperoxidase